jgi:type IV pilus assembly protein PilX
MKTRFNSQRGVSMLVVLVLLIVMLLGGLTFTRMTQVTTLAGGNAAFRAAAVQASDVGLDQAFAQVRGITAPETAVSGWYFPTIQADTNNDNIPDTADFDQGQAVTVGQYTVNYVVERMCDTAIVSDPSRQCLVKRIAPSSEGKGSRSEDKEALDPPTATQYRVTMRVTGPKSTQTFVQTLITKGT